MVVGSRAEVFHGNADHTSGGLTKSDMMMKEGRIISKAQSAAAKANPALKKWRNAVDKAKKKLKIPKTGEFVLVQGKLANTARKLFKKM